MPDPTFFAACTLVQISPLWLTVTSTRRTGNGFSDAKTALVMILFLLFDAPPHPSLFIQPGRAEASMLARKQRCRLGQ
jgi:hypothetical protein